MVSITGHLCLTVFVQMGRCLPFIRCTCEPTVEYKWVTQLAKCTKLVNMFMESKGLVNPCIYAKDRVITGSFP